MIKWIPIILIIVAIASFFFVIDPQYEQIKILKIKKEKFEEYLSKAEELRSRLDSLHADYNAISNTEREQLKKLLPDTVDNVRLVLDINNIAETYDMRIEDIVISEKIPNNSQYAFSEGEEGVIDRTLISDQDLIGTIALSFKVSSTYEVFNEFLSDLETKLRIVDVKQIDITDPEDGSLVYNYSIGLDTYWLR